MSASPVIIDDGGSTRIKLMLPDPSVGEMDKLLDVNEKAVPPQSTQKVDGKFTHVRITYIKRDGKPHEELDSALVSSDNFTVVSHNDQVLTLTFGSNPDCCYITLKGQPNSLPCVEAKQFKKKRRYVVANAGSIITIDGKANGAAIPQFDAGAVGSIYTTLVLS